MSVFQQEVKNRIAPYMKEKGFRIRGRTYYYIKNSIAFCISFEQPTGWMYTWAHVNPLYMPSNIIHLCYGNRLSDMSDVKLPALLEWSDSTDIDNWCELFFCHMDNSILPFFNQIDTPEKLVAFVEQPRKGVLTGRFRRSQFWDECLRMYTYLYLHDFPNAEDALNSYVKALPICNFITSLQEKKQREAEEIRHLILQGDDAVADFCDRIISDTIRLFHRSK